MKDIILYWIQWSGKWTQSKKLLEHYWTSLKYFETWNILRALCSCDNILWNYIKDIIERWDYVPSKIINRLFDLWFNTIENWNFLLVDWYPRQSAQLDYLLDKYSNEGRKFVFVLLELSDDEALRRLWWRKICKQCKAVYNTNIDWELNICKSCWWELNTRSDDTPEAIKNRLKNHHKLSAPIISKFKDIWVLRIVDANKDIDLVFSDILKAIEN